MFLGRTRELKILDRFQQVGQLAVVYGRRRVGKSALLDHWGSTREGYAVSQIIQGPEKIQIEQIYEDIAHQFPSPVHPKNHEELLRTLAAAFIEI